MLIGSVKSNLGHLEAAAGIAGLAKAVPGGDRAKVLPNRGYSDAQPHIPFEKLRLKAAAAQTAMAGLHGPTRNGGRVSSFGFGGTNAHVVIEGPLDGTPSPNAPDPARRR